ncbi:MAG: sulfatase-like hydrolase/transferase [Candidatus Aminicenantes bacterium]|nr:sulfatase-like hydrolase/transferase [Candidatus Aminicenantes bacterium]
MEKNKHRYPNIILIVVDALRARNLGCYGRDRDSSPNIDKIADKGVLFENVYCSWNTTDQSLTAILSGRYPRTHGIVHHGYKVKPEDLNAFETLNVRLLSQVLQENGYETLAVDWMARWFKRGFDYYGYTPKRNLLRKLIYYIFTLPYVHLKYIVAHLGLLRIYSKKRGFTAPALWKGLKDIFRTFLFSFKLARIQDARLVTELAKELIKRPRKENFFLFLHYWDTHTPYNCPRNFFEKKKRHMTSKEVFISKYNGAVRYVDQQIGRLFDVLREERFLEDTLIIITSDHGESLIEHDIFFDHHGLYDVTTHVPLILNYPKAFSGPRRVKGLIQHIDLAPTLYELLNIKYKDYGLDGASLMPLIRGKKTEIRHYAFNEESYVQRKIGIRTKKFKYIFSPDGVGMCNYCQQVHGGEKELYNLEVDPEEKVNIAVESKIIADEMKKELNDLIKSLNSKKQKDFIKGGIFRLRKRGRLDDDNLVKGEFSDMKNEKNEKQSTKKEKVTLELPEGIMKEIKRRIEDTEFQSGEEYLSYIIHEALKGSSSRIVQNSKEEKKIKKKLRSLGYMD